MVNLGALSVGAVAAVGRLAVAIALVRHQAFAEKHSLATEVRYLVLHGLLHALGYDHETDDDKMNTLEMKVRKRVGLR